MKLHLGCGKRYIPGYVHIDAIDFPHVDHVATIDHLSFIEDNSVDVIYNCHVLEHFKRRDLSRVLQEWRRVLKPGGTLRTSVPNFAVVCEIYQRTSDIRLVIGLCLADKIISTTSITMCLISLRCADTWKTPDLFLSASMIGEKSNMRMWMTILKPTCLIWTKHQVSLSA